MKYDLIIVKSVITGTPPMSSSVPVSVLGQNLNFDFAKTVYSSSISKCITSFSPKVVLTGSYQIGTLLN